MIHKESCLSFSFNASYPEQEEHINLAGFTG